MIAVVQDCWKIARQNGWRHPMCYGMTWYRMILIAVWQSNCLRLICDSGRSNRHNETRTLTRGYPPLIRRLAANRGG